MRNVGIEVLSYWELEKLPDADDDVLAVINLIGQPNADDLADNRCVLPGAIKDGIVAGGWIEPRLAHDPEHRGHLVAPLAQAAQLGLQTWIDGPHAGLPLFGQRRPMDPKQVRDFEAPKRCRAFSSISWSFSTRWSASIR
jgi:hypothetical protein